MLAVLTAASVARAHRHRGTHGSAPATGPERSGHRGAYGVLVLRFARLFAACGYADRGPEPAGTRTPMPLRSPTGPGLGAPAPPRFAAALLCAQNAVVGWDQPSPALSDGTAGEAGGSGPPAPAPSPTLPRGPGPPCPRARPHRAGQAGCRAVGGGRRYERSVLRPSPGVGGPAGLGVGRRPQRMRRLWRAPEDHRRPDRSDLDPDLSGGGRAAGGAPAEGPAAAAVRVRGLTSPPFAPGAVSRREECVLNGLIEYRIGPATGPQTTKPYCESCQTTCKRSSASLPCPLGVFGALTRGPKRCLILPILGCIR